MDRKLVAKLRREQALENHSKGVFSGTYAGELFQGSTWINFPREKDVSNFPSETVELKESLETVEQVVEEDKVIHERLEEPTEQEKAVKAMFDFTEKKSSIRDDLVRELNFPGGKVEISSTSISFPLTNKLNSLKELREAFPEYLKLLEHLKEGALKTLFLADIDEDILSNENMLFHGERGDLLKRIIQAMNYKDGEWNFAYLGKELNSRYFTSLISILRPTVVVVLGARPLNKLMKRNYRLSKLHGKFIDLNIGDALKVQLMPIFHPDNILINPNMKRSVWQDLQKIMSYLGNAK